MSIAVHYLPNSIEELERRGRGRAQAKGKGRCQLSPLATRKGGPIRSSVLSDGDSVTG